MSIVRLGKIHLHWCENCNVPIVEKGSCGSCGAEAKKVKITPPGDVRPAFEHDIELIKDTIDRQWGEGYSKKILSEEKAIVLNSTPYIDRMDEVIVDGKVIGAIRYNPKNKLEDEEPYEFILRPWKGLPAPKKNFVIVDKGAVEPIMNGGSVLNPGITDTDEDITPGDEVIVLGPDKEIVCAGPAQLDGKEMMRSSSGKGVKNRWRRSDHTPKDKEASWKEAVKANEHLIEERVGKAVSFIQHQLEKHDLPEAVAYSGGKDSLATLLLLLEASREPDIIFVDTGIELPETVENVEKVAEKYDLDLLKREAESGYWNNVDHFGPSARDYRWCCKTCKLGPTALLIKENYPEGVLSFIGQRKYESSQRKKQGSTWNNPWVPGQRSASPIQDWTALHVWLYLFKKDAEWNPWYEKGFERIGCWVCPASDLAELEKLKDEFSEYERFEDVLKSYAERNELPKEWVELGLWRWLDTPEEMKKFLPEEITVQETEEEKSEPQDLLEHRRTRNLLNALIDVEEEGVEDLDEEEVLSMHKKAMF
ncbi:MAG: phosphoadenosine phosphosulfate reductase family protein, partial [Candidatus Aenigmatarchaeota archaeon]